MHFLKEFFTFFHTYGLYGFIRLIIDVICSRVAFSNVRIIRRPFYIRNIGKIYFGSGFTSGVGLRIDVVEKEAELIVGKNVQLNDYCHIGVSNKITIGDGTLIASKVFITDHGHGNIKKPCTKSSPLIPPILRPLENSPVFIGSNVWIGEGVLILPGVTIGSGSIIGAGSVVTKSVPENVIAVGNPAKPIKKYNFDTCNWEQISLQKI